MRAHWDEWDRGTMSTAEPLTTVIAEPIQEQSVLTPEELPGKRKLGLGAWLSIGWLAVITLSAILAPILPIADPNETNTNIFRKGPLHGSLLGGDGNGLDVFARCIWGARVSLIVGVGAIVFALIFGGTLGLLAGYYRGRTDTILTSSFDILLALPALVLALTLIAVLSPNSLNSPPTEFERLRALILTLGIVSIPVLARITRANTLAWAQRDFVMAARAMGAKDRRIIIREVLPNVAPAMFSIALLGVAVVIVTEGGLALLGLSIPAPGVSWGLMIAQAQGDLQRTPWAVFAPSFFIFLTVLSLNYLGDVVRARFDVRGSAL
jgi:peptide/nickel transport system permease protein